MLNGNAAFGTGSGAGGDTIDVEAVREVTVVSVIPAANGVAPVYVSDAPRGEYPNTPDARQAYSRVLLAAPRTGG